MSLEEEMKKIMATKAKKATKKKTIKKKK